MLRDEQLAALGRAAASVDAPALSGFRQTLEAVEAEAADAVVRREAAAQALAVGEAEARDTQEQHDRLVEVAREALAPLERRLRELRTRQEALEQAASTRAGQRRNLETRLVRLQEKLADASLEAEGRRALTDEQADASARLVELEQAALQDEPALAELAEPVAAVRAQVAQAALALEAARDGRRSARMATEARLAELAAALRGAQNHEEALTRRRQAVWVDLGHASLERPEIELAGRQEATAALEQIEQIRTTRTRLERDRAELDRGPMHRTLLAVGGGLLALLLIWAAW